VETNAPVLLASQRVGTGQTAVLTCDALCAGKLQQPSASRDVEKFCSSFSPWLGRERSIACSSIARRWYADVGQSLTLRVHGTNAAPTPAVPR